MVVAKRELHIKHIFMKNYLVLLLLAIVTLSSCKKETPPQTVFPCSPTPPEREYYFTAKVLDECRTLNAGNYDYKVSCLGTIINGQRYVTASIDTYPLHAGDKRIRVSSSYFEEDNFDEFLGAFALGEKVFFDYSNPDVKGFRVDYSVCTDFEDYSNYHFDHYNSYRGDQTGSTIELVEFAKIPEFENRYKVKFLINCKLYNSEGDYAGMLKDGNLVAQVAW